MNNSSKILSLLKKHYKDATIALNYSNSLELLVAVILSAQCTDKRVNLVTNELFKKYKTPEDYASVSQEEFEQDIRSTGFYRNKAKNIRAAAQMIIDDFEGQVPKTMAEIIMLPGVARKTGNIVLSSAFGVVEGIAVDTHVIRLSGRLGFTTQKNPVKIEQDLMTLFSEEEWLKLSYYLIDHGRAICDAKKPKCDKCFLNKLCPSAYKFPAFEK